MDNRGQFHGSVESLRRPEAPAGRAASPASVSVLVPAARDHDASRRAARYVLLLLFCIYTANYLDRQLLSILMEPVRRALHLSDAELGFLSGFAFAMFYATLGIPIARLADRSSRKAIVTISLAIWSIMTAASGMAMNFLQIVIARIGVGVGEAGGSPPAHAMIADYFPPSRRAGALAVYSTGIPVGMLLGLALGGWINQAFGWRMAFVVVGLPGLVLALLFALTAKEPVRGAQEGGHHEEMPGTLACFRHLWRVRTFRTLSIATALHAFTAYGMLQWYPSFLIRSFHTGTALTGLFLGLIIGIGGAVGTLGGGFLADRMGERDARWHMHLPAIAIAISIPFYFATYLAGSFQTSLLFFIAPSFLTPLFTGPSFAAVQSLSPVRMRALAASVFLFIINIVGLGLGPQVVGILSDLLHGQLGAASLRWALCIVTLAEIAAAYYYFRAGASIGAELQPRTKQG